MAEAQYRAATVEGLIVVPLDDLTLVYHRASGITHLLASPAPELLTALAAGPCTARALLDRLAADFDLPDGEAPRLLVRLEELAAAGLVTTA